MKVDTGMDQQEIVIDFFVCFRSIRAAFLQRGGVSWDVCNNNAQDFA